MKLFTKICCFFFFCGSLMGQNRMELQKRKKKLLEEIQLTNQMLEQTKKEKSFSLNQLKTLKQKIEIRSQLIRTMQKELDFIKDERSLCLRQIKLLELDLEALKDGYALMIEQSYRSSRHFNRLLFLFSSRDFQQAYKRFAMIKQISEYRKSRATKIEFKQNEIKQNLGQLKKFTKIKEQLIKNTKYEKMLFDEEQVAKSIGLNALSNKEKQLRQDVAEKNLKKEKIQNEIQRIITEELKKKKNNNKKTNFTNTPEARALSKSFTSNKAILPWPVSKGFVISKFGKQKHPILKNVSIENNGIEIATETNSVCRSIFDGAVSSILTMPNGTKVIMVRHGEYISVYSNLSESYVEKGDLVKTKDHLGVVFTSKSGGTTVIDFQLWQGDQKVNPESWLMKK
tara:strand:- start:7703 stop:8896 length:1194 start_codon:yes stop_codon:yes gene_type:complete